MLIKKKILKHPPYKNAFFPLPTAVTSLAVVKAKVVFCEWGGMGGRGGGGGSGFCSVQRLCLHLLPSSLSRDRLSVADAGLQCLLRNTLAEVRVRKWAVRGRPRTGKPFDVAGPRFRSRCDDSSGVIGPSRSVLQRKLGGPVAPVCGPFLFVDFPRLLCLELGPVPARDLHRVVLGQFVFVVGPLEETTLGGAQERDLSARLHRGRPVSR